MKEISPASIAEYSRELNAISIRFTETTSEDELLQEIARSFRNLTRAFAAGASRYNRQTSTLSVAALSIDEGVAEQVASLLNSSLYSIETSPPPAIRQMMISQVIAMPKSLTELTFGVVPEDVSTQIMQMLGIEGIIALSLSHGAEILGTVVGFYRGTDQTIPDEALKTFAHLAAAAVARARVEHALRESEETHRALVEGLPDIVMRFDRQGRHLFVSDNVRKVADMEAAQFIGKTHAELGFPESQCRFWKEAIRRVFDSGASFETEFSVEGKAGATTFNWRLVPERDAQGVVCSVLSISRDVTERKRAEEALRIKGRAIQSSINAMAISDLAGNLTYVNSAFLAFWGYQDQREVLGRPAVEFWHTPDDAVQAIVALQTEGVWQGEMVAVRRDGTGFTVDVAASMIEDEAGQPSRMIAAFVDITERKQAEQALRESEQRFRGLYEVSPLGIILVDQETGRYLEANDAFLSMVGYTLDELRQLSYSDLTPERYAESDREQIALQRATGRWGAYEKEYIRKDGSTFPLVLNGVMITNPSGRRLVWSMVEDITERKRAEEALKNRLVYDHLLARLSSMAVTMTDLDQFQDECLAAIGEALKVSRAYIFEHRHENDTVSNTAEWCASGVSAQKDNLQDIPTDSIPWWVQTLQAGQSICYSDIEDIPDNEAKRILRDQDILSVWVVPLFVEGQYFGFMGFDECSRHREWPEDDTGLILSMCRVITGAIERRRAEKALRASEERYRSLIEQSNDAIYLLYGDHFELINPRFEALFGVTQEEIRAPGFDFTSLVAPQSRPLVLERQRKRDAGEVLSPHYEFTALNREGDEIEVDASVSYIAYRDGIATQGILRDITERKRAETAMRRQLEELAVLHAVASACAEATDEDSLIVELTGLLHQALYPEDLGLFMVDTTAGGLRPHPSYRISAGVPKELIPFGDGLIGQAAKEGQPCRAVDVLEEPGYIQASPTTRSEVAVPIKLGERVIAVINAESSQPGFFTADDERLLSTVAGQLATAIERIRLDQETRQRLTELEALHRASREIIAAGTDPERIYASVHRVVAELMPCEAFLITLRDPAHNENEGVYLIDKGKRWPNMRYPADEGLSGLVILRGEAILVDDYVQQDNVAGVHFGAPEPVRSILAVPLRAGERVVGMLSAQTYRPHAYTRQDQVLLETLANHVAAGLENTRLFQQIHEQARRVQGIIDTVPEGMLLLDANQRILLANPVVRRDLVLLTGGEVGDVLTHLSGRPLAELLTSPPQGLWHEIEAGGRIFEVVARPIENGPEPEWWVLVISDVTQARAVRRQLEQQERLATVGQLAAGIAHDFNNILASITLYAHLALHSPDLSPELGERMQVILAEAGSAANLVQQILDFSRRAVIERRPLDLLPLLKEQVRLLERTLPEHIEIELAYGREQHITLADPTRVQQVIVNLALNAHDAMPDGGTLRISLRRASEDELVRCVTCGAVTEGEWIEVAVTDTGTGIPPDILPRIFEPFFTTRAPLGHGLGLAQVYGIVKQHEGHLDVETEMTVGTTFRLYWPALQVAAAAPSVRSETAIEGQGETILVVEDDATLRGALADCLKALNYAVLTVAHGREALGVLELHHDEIALVLSDWVMPVMGGLALAQEMEARFPGIGVLMLTGHPLNEATRADAPAGVIGWLQKPLGVKELSAAVAQAIRGEA